MNEQINHGRFHAALSLIWSNRSVSSRTAQASAACRKRRSLDCREITRHRADLCVRQAMRDGLHDGGVVRIALVLAALLVPVRQLLMDVVVKLSCQTRKCVAALGVIAMT